MTASELEAELRALDERISVIPNPNRPGLSNVKLDGIDICPVPSDDIKEMRDENYRYTFPTGHSAPHNSKADVMQRVHHVLTLLETEEGRELFYDK